MDTKQHILQKTFELLLLKGYDAVSISDIQRETSMARGLLYHYFGNKETLFKTAAKRYLLECFNTDLSSTSNYKIPEMIEYIIEKYGHICDHSWADFKLSNDITIAHYDFLIYRLTQEDSEFAAMFDLVWKREKIAWENAATNSINAGDIRENLSAQEIGSFIEYLINGVWFEKISYKETGPLVVRLREILNQYYKLLRPI